MSENKNEVTIEGLSNRRNELRLLHWIVTDIKKAKEAFREIKKEDFQREEMKALFKIVMGYIDKYDILPTRKAIEEIARNNCSGNVELETAIISTWDNAWHEFTESDDFQYIKKTFVENRIKTEATEKLSQLADAVKNSDFREISKIGVELARIESKVVEDSQDNTWTVNDILNFDLEKSGDSLIGKGYINKRDSVMFLAEAGLGKSVLVYQLMYFWGLGKTCFGLRPNKPLKSLCIQAENSLQAINRYSKDIILDLLKPNKAEMELLNKNVIIINETARTGNDLFPWLEKKIEETRPDILILDPLFAYLGGDNNKAEVVAEFFRKNLQTLANRYGFASFVVHHTNKPPKQNEKSTFFDGRYDGAGSAELTNFFRKIIRVSLVPETADREWHERIFCLQHCKNFSQELAENAKQKTYLKYADIKFDGSRPIYWQETEYVPPTKEPKLSKKEKTERDTENIVFLYLSKNGPMPEIKIRAELEKELGIKQRQTYNLGQVWKKCCIYDESKGLWAWRKDEDFLAIDENNAPKSFTIPDLNEF